MTAADLADLAGAVVTAKRLGWDDGEDAVRDLDVEPYAEKGYESPDLSGVLSVSTFPLPGGRTGTLCLVGGQEADPGTVRPAG